MISLKDKRKKIVLLALKDMGAGRTFMYEGLVYIKILPIIRDGNMYNSLNLINGKFECFPDSAKFQLVNIEVCITSNVTES